MGAKIYTAPFKKNESNHDDFQACAARLSQKDRVNAEEAKKSALESMKRPIAIFTTYYGKRHKKVKLCAICEEAEQEKYLAKAVAKRINRGERIVINSNLKHIKKAIKHHLKKRGLKQTSVVSFNRAAEADTTIYLIE